MKPFLSQRRRKGKHDTGANGNSKMCGVMNKETGNGVSVYDVRGEAIASIGQWCPPFQALRNHKTSFGLHNERDGRRLNSSVVRSAIITTMGWEDGWRGKFLMAVARRAGLIVLGGPKLSRDHGFTNDFSTSRVGSILCHFRDLNKSFRGIRFISLNKSIRHIRKRQRLSVQSWIWKTGILYSVG
jgi:hypothetical protein